MDNNRFKGSNRMLLQEYFDLKVKLSDLQVSRRFRDTEEIQEEINKTETSIVETLSMFDRGQLLQIIYMGLDIDYDNLVDKGYVDKRL